MDDRNARELTRAISGLSRSVDNLTKEVKKLQEPKTISVDRVFGPRLPASSLEDQ